MYIHIHVCIHMTCMYIHVPVHFKMQCMFKSSLSCEQAHEYTGSYMYSGTSTASDCGTNILCSCISYLYYYVLTIFSFLSLFPSFNLCKSTSYINCITVPYPILPHFCTLCFVSCMHTWCARMCDVTLFYVMCLWMHVYMCMCTACPMLHTRMCSSICVWCLNVRLVLSGNTSRPLRSARR